MCWLVSAIAKGTAAIPTTGANSSGHPASTHSTPQSAPGSAPGDSSTASCAAAAAERLLRPSGMSALV